MQWWYDFEDRRIKAITGSRKEHICIECGGKIPKRTYHLYLICGKKRVCSSCEKDWQELIEEINCYHFQATPLYGSIIEAVKDAVYMGRAREDHSLIMKWVGISEGRRELSEKRKALSEMERFSRPLFAFEQMA